MSVDCRSCGIAPERGKFTRGLCSRCYKRHRQNGTLDEFSPLDRVAHVQLGTRRFQKDGYVTVMTEHGFKPEHRVVMEKILGRPLVAGETVHHKNAVRSDNSPENLELWFAQPAGARVCDLVDYVVTFHSHAVKARMDSVPAKPRITPRRRADHTRSAIG